MANTKSGEQIDLKTFKRDLDTACRHVAKEVGEEIQLEYSKQIRWFYEDYSPSSYKRTYSLWTASSGYGHKQTWGRNKYMSYWGGITVDSSQISGDPYRKPYLHGWNTGDVGSSDFKRSREERESIKRESRGSSPHWRVPTAEIFERSFLKGIHGFTRGYTVYSTWKRGKKKGDSSVQTILNKPIKIPSIKKMSPSPERGMRDYWKKIGKEVGERIGVELARINL